MSNLIRSGRSTLGRDTSGAVGLADCLAAGMTYEQVKWALESGRWQSPYPRTYVVFSGPMPLLTRQHAALIYAGADSVLSHETAGHRWRLCSEPALISLTVPFRRKVDPQPGLTIARSRTLSDLDIHPSLLPRRTRIERTVLDLLPSCHDAEGALGLVADAVRGRATTPDRLRSALNLRPGTQWRAVVLEALPDLKAGAHSALELRDAKLRSSHGLRLGQRQARRLVDGTEYLDILIPEWQLHVELDGRLGTIGPVRLGAI